MPSRFTIAPTRGFALAAPEVPVGLPSELLQPRPDIAGAGRRMAAANAAIGVSRAAFYPNVTLNGAAGFQDTAFNLLSVPNRLWSAGAGAMLPLFEGGLRRAELQRSWSQYAQTRDDYRATVLTAFQDVEDGMSLTQRRSRKCKHWLPSSSRFSCAFVRFRHLFPSFAPWVADGRSNGCRPKAKLSNRSSSLQETLRNDH
jgi:outer membrane protein TolC